MIDEELRQAADRSDRPARGGAGGQPVRGVVLQPHGARRRVRRQGRSAQLHTTSRPATRTTSTRISRVTERSIRRTSVRPSRTIPAARRRVVLIVVPEKQTGPASQRRMSPAMMSRIHAALVVLLSASSLVGVAAFAQAPDRTKPPQSGPPPDAATARRSRSASSRTDFRSGSSNCTRVPVVQVNLFVVSGGADDPPRQLRRRQHDRSHARTRARDRATRCRSPTRSTISAPTFRRAAGLDSSAVRAARRRSRGSPKRCPSWPTSRCGRRSLRRNSTAFARNG